MSSTGRRGTVARHRPHRPLPLARWTGASPRSPCRRSARWPRSRSTWSPTPPSSGAWVRSRWLAWPSPRRCCCSSRRCAASSPTARRRGWRVPAAPTTPPARPGSACSRCGSASSLGLPLAAALALFARPVVQLLGGEGAALDAAVTYLRISAIGVPFVLLALVGAGVFRGVADLRTPAGHRVHGERRQPAARDRRRVRARPGHRRVGVEHRRRADRRRGCLPAAHAPPPGRRAVPPARSGRAGPARPVGEPPRAAGRLAHRRLRHRHRGRGPHRHAPPSPPTRSSTPCSPCSRCRWTRSPSPRRPSWPRRSAPAIRGWPGGWGSGCSCCPSSSAARLTLVLAALSPLVARVFSGDPAVTSRVDGRPGRAGRAAAPGVGGVRARTACSSAPATCASSDGPW